ncbi:helix-turn-helix domain-containing protein [Streptomyces sp. NBC_01304]|uniref:helix-turn-helix domain-containing protein n=1 Tax=Streptomyces sp. NBC_01304 TaxID=2903818 RepID=UPI002E106D42|nr:MerR family transcriptional regulator [Streptomyces sp. NBC_01304]
MSKNRFRDKPLTIGEVSELTSLTPRTIRYYHEIGLVPEPGRDGAGNRAYRFEEITRLLWVQRMAAAGLSLEAVKEAAEATDDQQIQTLLTELDRILAAKEEQLRQQRAAVARLREFGSARGLFTPEVAAAHQAGGLDVPSEEEQGFLLLLEATHGVGAALGSVQSDAFLAGRPHLEAAALRLSAQFDELADAAVDDPRVEVWAQEMAAQCAAVEAEEEASGVRHSEIDFTEVDERSLMLGAQAMGAATVQPSAAQERAMERYLELAMAGYFEENPRPGAEQ